MDWNELANTRSGDVEAPAMLPQGHYQCMFAGAAKRDQTKKGTLFVEHPFRVIDSMSDVDQAELEAAGGLPDKAQDLTFYLTDKSLFRYTDFGKAMGASEDLNIIELCDYLSECQEPFVIEARHEESDRNPGRFFLRWDNPIPLSQFSDG